MYELQETHVVKDAHTAIRYDLLNILFNNNKLCRMR